MFDWEPAFCHLVVSRHCTALCCAIVCDMLKPASPTQYFLKQDSASLWQWARTWYVYCLLFLERLPSVEATLWGKLLLACLDGKGWRWHLVEALFKDSQGKQKPESSVKAGMGTGAVGAGGPWGEVVSHANPNWFALQCENVPAPCQKVSCGNKLTSPYF